MNCKEFSERISEYIDAEAGKGVRATVDRHLSECPACARLLKDMLALTDRLARLPRLRPTAGFDFALRSRLLMEVSKEMRWQRKVRRLLFPTQRRTFLAAAAVVILAVGLTAAYRQGAIWQPSELAVSQQAPDLLPAASIDRGALKRISQEESYTLSHRLYRPERSRPDSLEPQTPKSPLRQAENPPEAQRVTVRF